jgi:hypothetical protein
MQPIRGSQPPAMVITPDGKNGFFANANSSLVTPISLAALPPLGASAPGGAADATGSIPM